MAISNEYPIMGNNEIIEFLNEKTTNLIGQFELEFYLSNLTLDERISIQSGYVTDQSCELLYLCGNNKIKSTIVKLTNIFVAVTIPEDFLVLKFNKIVIDDVSKVVDNNSFTVTENYIREKNITDYSALSPDLFRKKNEVHFFNLFNKNP